MNEGPEWFAPKRFGLGSGLPVAWQGWVVLIGYIAAIAAASVLLAERSVPAFLSLTTALTGALCLVCAKTTRGGWRWRWNEKE